MALTVLIAESVLALTLSSVRAITDLRLLEFGLVVYLLVPCCLLHELFLYLRLSRHFGDEFARDRLCL